MFNDLPKIADAFRGGGGMSWGEHHPCLFKGTEWFFRTGYRAHLPAEWIPALDGVEEKLRAGARVAKLRAVFEEAGFTRFHRAAETPINLIIQARP